MDNTNPFSDINTCGSYTQLWGLAFLLVLVQAAATALLVVFEKFSGLMFNSFEGMLPAMGASAYISWKLLERAGVDWRGAAADWRRNAAGDLKKALKYLAGYAAILCLFAVLLLAVYALSGGWIARILAPVAASNLHDGELLRATAAASAPRLLLALFTICAAAPVVEELFFRRIFYATLRKRARFWTSALWSGGLFAVFHGAAAPIMFPAGLYLCWVYEKERRLPVNILLHAMVNLSLLLYRLA